MSSSSIVITQTASLAPVNDFPIDQDKDVIDQLLADTRFTEAQFNNAFSSKLALTT